MKSVIKQAPLRSTQAKRGLSKEMSDICMAKLLGRFPIDHVVEVYGLANAVTRTSHYK